MNWSLQYIAASGHEVVKSGCKEMFRCEIAFCARLD